MSLSVGQGSGPKGRWAKWAAKRKASVQRLRFLLSRPSQGVVRMTQVGGLSESPALAQCLTP